MINFIKAPNLSALSHCVHGFFTREGGISQGAFSSLNGDYALADDPLFVKENRNRVCAALGVKLNPFVSCKQIHSSEVMVVAASWNEKKPPRADALVTRKPGFVLGILTADCAPILFADKESGVIGAAHAGWRGAFGGVVENTLAAMERIGAKRHNIAAAVGPCIWQESYEVSEDFMKPFLEQDRHYERFFASSQKQGHCQFDLPGYVVSRLQEAGIEDIAPSPADTFQDAKRFYSYRRDFLKIESNTGRLMSAIALV